MPTPPTTIHLRPVVPADIPVMFEIQLDPEGNRLAGTKPRDLATFQGIWERILGMAPGTSPDPATLPRIIVADGEFAGIINIFMQEGNVSVGYWLAREHWGRGIATRAIGLMLEEFTTRPVHARVISHNAASLRALEKNGFVIVSREYGPETERYTAGEEVKLVLE